MKARIIEKTETKKFQPITVEITFESMDEVIDFYARVNAAAVNIMESVPKGESYTVPASTGLFSKIARPIYEKAKTQQQ